MTVAPRGAIDTACEAAFVAACNVEPRKDGTAPDLLLLHYTGMDSAPKAVEWLVCAQSRVSCHYLVDEAGRITQMVPESERAWHAGVSSWAGETDINSRSIGIEIHHPGHVAAHEPYTEPQMAAVTALCRDIVRRHGIAPERVLGHSDVAPARKDDPGEWFDWQRLWRAGVGHWVPPEPLGDDRGIGPGDGGPVVAALQKALAEYGYGIDVTGAYDRLTEQVVTAFQRHWRPARVDGRFDSSTAATLRRLQKSVPDRTLIA